MSAAVAYQLADLDQQIADAHQRVQAARAACRRSPNAGSIEAVRQAVGQRDQLLDQRFALQPRRPSSGS